MNGWLMSRDDIIAEIKDGAVRPVNEALLPLYFRQPNSALDKWLRLRAIDTGRPNSRLLRKRIGLSDVETGELVLSVNAATITDTYWIKRDGENLSWKDVVFRRNDLASTALLGNVASPPKNPAGRTPELTNTGSFEKCWQLRDGVWWLYKVGFHDHLFSEMTACRLCRHFGYPTANYAFADPKAEGFIGKIYPSQGIIRTEDFTGGAKMNFEPGAAMGMRSSDPGYNYREFLKLSEELAQQYVELLTMDALVNNVDRHNQNFGVLRHVETGEILRLAPNFDNNLSLLTNTTPRDLDTDSTLKEWRDTVQGNLVNMVLPALSDQALSDLLESVAADMEHVTGCTLEQVDREAAAHAILVAYRFMEAVCEQLHRFHNPGPPTT